jgi:hypothetical protein
MKEHCFTELDHRWKFEKCTTFTDEEAKLFTYITIFLVALQRIFMFNVFQYV